MIIKNGHIIDGTGNPWFQGDIKIQDGKIIEIKKNINKSDEVINANGLCVTPGFIDVHSHGDARILKHPEAPNKIKQGITTAVMGNCGSTLAPLTAKNRSNMKKTYERLHLDWDWRSFGEYLEKLEGKDLAINIIPLVGHSTLRSAVLGYEDRKPSEEELSEMKALLAEGMKAGGFGLSTGLGYVPGVYSTTEELIELGKVVAKYHGIYASHLRNQGGQLTEATREAIQIGEENSIPVQLSHYKATRENWSNLDSGIQLIEEKREEGIEVNFDAYPYHASSSSLQSLLPSWAREGGNTRILERLEESKTRTRILNELRENKLQWETIMIAYSRTHPEYEGKRISEVAKNKGEDPYEFCLDLLVEDELATRRVTFCMKKENITKKVKHPWCAIGSDGGIHTTSLEGVPHPRYYGTFPRVIAKFVREKEVLSLEDAIRKMTSLPAQQIGVKDRGILKEGMAADIVVFDPKKIQDRATFQQPKRFPEGIKYVIVNGEVAIKGGKYTGNLLGSVLRRNT